MCTYRRLNIEHKINENLHKQNYLSNLNFHKYQEQLFYRKINYLTKTLGHTHHNVNNEHSLTTPNCSARIQNHFRLLNFSTETEKRLSYQSNSNSNRSCRSAIKHPLLRKSYLNQQILDEHQRQMNNDQRKSSLMKEFDDLKHTINDPNSTISVLAALSRTLIFLDSGTE